MTEEDLKALQKSVRKKKRIATELASKVHDIVEDSLWTEYDTLVAVSQQTYEACVAWKEASKELEQAEAATAS
ncbi:MAG: hypothetical protein MI976_17025 [Pseudomonadales bacterium]|nr:hypothetical protein [Pseudomonadales bacterium]